ncbi:MAG: deoxyguanosinetriphosphate triphosphohydrolase [Candidatus Omnitrophica bacterium]|nr:deoxyguanosinetriphosphate triphosphohydrolase [Candidatus Omnitrophota bacterium]
MKISRQSYQETEAQILAPYAVWSAHSRGRKYPEKEHHSRTAFQRDRDRIIHSTAFRRLQYKTQVFVNHEGDHYRTRLTHTLEVAQISRSLCRALALNEDLAEAIALAHDLGHGPFGHAGEMVLQEMMKDHGGFEHNQQSLRIVEKLEESYPDFPGLNLTHETLAGLKKHFHVGASSPSGKMRFLEAEIVDVADEIAYISHDLDDGLRSALIQEPDLEGIELWRDACRYIHRKYKTLTAEKKRRLGIRLLINRLVTDLVESTEKRIGKFRICRLTDIRKVEQPVVVFSSKIKGQVKQLKQFLGCNLYGHYRVVRMTDKGQRCLKSLFEIYLQKPEQFPREILLKCKKEGIRRTICDYLAGMTDRFALDEYKRFFEPYERV